MGTFLGARIGLSHQSVAFRAINVTVDRPIRMKLM